VTPEILQSEVATFSREVERALDSVIQAFWDSPRVKYGMAEQVWWSDLLGPCCTQSPSTQAMALAINLRWEIVDKYSPGPLRVESVFVSMLPQGGLIVPHADNEKVEGGKWVPNHTANRTFGSCLYLNDEFEGGELDFPGLRRRFKPKRGMLVAWPADHRFVHQVLPVTRGIRLSLPVWFEPERSENRGF